MDRSIDPGLDRLKERLLLMGGYVEKALEEATQALLEGDPSRFARVHEIETRINQMHLEVDELSFKLLATQAPLAADLRLILAVIKINTDLERMGDQVVNIALNSADYMRAPPVKPLVDLPRMAEQTRVMVRECLDSLVRKDAQLAEQVLTRDDHVDEAKDRILRDVAAVMKADSDTIEQGLCLILIARNLERIADHATNVAEDVIFVVTGRDVRHGGRPPEMASSY